ncbi:hypothetical protein MTO96_020337 [Rhipicephalus appendiculatus]
MLAASHIEWDLHSYEDQGTLKSPLQAPYNCRFGFGCQPQRCRAMGQLHLDVFRGPPVCLPDATPGCERPTSRRDPGAHRVLQMAPPTMGGRQGSKASRASEAAERHQPGFHSPRRTVKKPSVLRAHIVSMPVTCRWSRPALARPSAAHSALSWR